MLRSLILSSVLLLTSGPAAWTDEAMKLMGYFSYFEGTWAVTELGGDSKGSMTIKRGESGTCHVLDYHVGDDRKTELWGYDPNTQHWTAIGFNQNGERFSQVMMDVPERAAAEAGDRFWNKHEGALPTGEKTTARIDFLIESNDAYSVKVTNIAIGENKLADAAFRITRQR